MKKMPFILVGLSLLFLTGCTEQDRDISQTTPETVHVQTTDYSSMQSKMKPEKIEIIEFHTTQRCATCLKAEELLKKTLDTKFGEEVTSGVLTFKDVNIDSTENMEITNKFQATGLSVALNTVVNGKDSIEYDTNGWRLISNEDQYIAYFENKITTLLGK